MARARTRIAVIDDELSVRTALGRLLTASAFETKTYGSAREFVESLRHGEPECIVVDVHMPECSGIDLHRHLRRNERRIPTIIVTAFDDAEIRSKCLALGVDGYLTKPIDAMELIRLIQTITGGGGERRQTG
jgi:FixJ family two-component response regulator